MDKLYIAGGAICAVVCRGFFAFAPTWMAYAAIVVLPILFLLAVKSRAPEASVSIARELRFAKPDADKWFYSVAIWMSGFALSFALTNLVPEAQEQTPEITPWFIIFAVVIAPVAEELFFRGFLMRCSEGFPLFARIGAVAVVFALYHSLPWGALTALVFGITAGIASYASRSVVTSIVLHALNNAAVILLTFAPQKEFPVAASIALAVAGVGIAAASAYKLLKGRVGDAQL